MVMSLHGSGPARRARSRERSKNAAKDSTVGRRGSAAAAPSGSQPFGLIGGQGQALASEEGFQGTGERPRRSL